MGSTLEITGLISSISALFRCKTDAHPRTTTRATLLAYLIDVAPEQRRSVNQHERDRPPMIVLDVIKDAPR